MKNCKFRPCKSCMYFDKETSSCFPPSNNDDFDDDENIQYLAYISSL